MNDLQCEAIQDEECEEVNINIWIMMVIMITMQMMIIIVTMMVMVITDQQMNIVGQFSHSQVEEEDCSGVAADSGAVCGDFHFFPVFFSQFVHIFILLRSMKTALRLFVTLSRLRSATQSEFQHKYKNCKHKVSKSTNTKL